MSDGRVSTDNSSIKTEPTSKPPRSGTITDDTLRHILYRFYDSVTSTSFAGHVYSVCTTVIGFGVSGVITSITVTEYADLGALPGSRIQHWFQTLPVWLILIGTVVFALTYIRSRCIRIKNKEQLIEKIVDDAFPRNTVASKPVGNNNGLDVSSEPHGSEGR